METPIETSLYSKLSAIMGEVERIPKSGKNTHFNYTFATEGDISDAIRNLLSEHNVAVFVSLIRWEQRPAGNSLKTICDFEFTLACGDTGATRSCLWSAEANDSQDKGFNKTATAAMKYWLLKTFMIPTGDDPDADGTSQGKASIKQRPRQNPYTPQRPSQPATTPAPAQNAANGQPDAAAGQVAQSSNITPDWFKTPASQSWGVIKGWVLTRIYNKNTFHMYGSLHKHGITEDEKGVTLAAAWKDRPAGDVVTFLENRHEAEQQAS